MSMLEAITLMQSSEWLHSQLLQRPPVKRSVEVPSIEPAKDGYVGISMVTGQQWLDFAAMVDCPEFTDIPQLRFQIGRWDFRDWIREQIDPWMRERTVSEIVELGQLFRLPLAPLGNGSTIPDMDHLQARGVYIDNPAGFRQPRAPWLMSAARQAPVRDAPALGEADGVSGWPPRESVPRTRSAEAPLTGVRVVDFTAFWAGPAAAHSLAAFGADVIKIESIQRPDGIRYSGGMRTDVDDWWEYGWVFHAMNTNKRSVTLDLQSEDGLRLVKELVRQADVVIENFSPRVMDQFGLGADTLLELNPRVVVVRMPAFGLTGPWRDRVGFAPTMEQIAGLAWVTGLPDGPAGRTARCVRSTRGSTCGVRDARGAGVRRSYRPRPARRDSDDRDRAQRDRRADNRIRGFRDGHEAPGQSWVLGGAAGRLSVRRATTTGSR